jgi:formate/nitrite transporter FocA (FNT family)
LRKRLLFSLTDHGCDSDGGVFSAAPYKDEAIAYAIKKQVTPEWHQIFLRGIGCNWLVCLAAMLALQAKDLASKVVAMWFPIFGFVALGFDHVVANMFFVPIGIFLKAPGVSIGLYVWKGTRMGTAPPLSKRSCTCLHSLVLSPGIIPTALGNIIGGALMVGTYYWWMHLSSEAPISVNGIDYLPTAERSEWSLQQGRTKKTDEEQGMTSSSDTPQEETHRFTSRND